MKKLILFILFVLCPLELSSETIASYNVLRLGQSKKDYNALAKTMSQFDIVGLIEVMNEDGVRALVEALNNNPSIEWKYLVSNYKVGRTTYKEYYAYVYKTPKVELIHPVGFYLEIADEFEREPYGAMFKIGKFDFVFVLCHFIYGKDESEREEEASNLIYVYEYFRKISGDEKDVIIAGDFNLSANNPAFTSLLQRSGSIRYRINPTFKTTVGLMGLSNSYDNIFASLTYTWEIEYGGVYVPDIKDYLVYRKIVSDHLPVYIKVKTTTDDD